MKEHLNTTIVYGESIFESIIYTSYETYLFMHVACLFVREVVRHFRRKCSAMPYA